jgi:osmoprotectant transport system permease protein
VSGTLRFAVLLLLGALCGKPVLSASAPEVSVGSKSFTESVILGEMLRQLAEGQGATASHRKQLGGTRVLFNALLGGEIDAYPEYTGTLLQELLVDEGLRTEDQLVAALERLGLRMTEPLGFNNTYAIGVTSALAGDLGLVNISDLARFPDLAFGFANEFMDRADGWPGLSAHYGLLHRNVRGLDHDLAYRGLVSGAIQATDLYTTDAEIADYDLRALEDDLGFFPDYQAVILYRVDLENRAAAVASAFRRLSGRIDEVRMSAMNARVKLDGESESRVAARFLRETLGIEQAAVERAPVNSFWRHTREHLALVGISLGAAILLAIPLGILAARRPRLGQVILAVAGVVQTIPSLALFVFMIPLLGIGGPPAVVALFLYSLLPIIRNTHAGLKDISPGIIESATALGLPPSARLRIVELPLATRSILAGIKTSAVINVGTATLGALIGAGGYGQPILTGIRLDDTALILQGAVPAALLALLVQGLFELVERRAMPRGLRAASVPVDGERNPVN